jgi:hypothetical protein
MMPGVGRFFFLLAVFTSCAVGDEPVASSRPMLRGAVPGVEAERASSSVDFGASPDLHIDTLNDSTSASDIADLQQTGETMISTMIVVDEVNDTDTKVTSQWGIPRHPIARHYLCKAVFGPNHRFLRRACWWAGSSQSTMFLIDEDVNQTTLLDVLSHMDQSENDNNASDLPEESNDTTPVLSSEWGVPKHPIARHYLCKAVFGKDHRFLRHACWWAGGAQSTVHLVAEDMNMTSLLHALSHQENVENMAHASDFASEMNTSIPMLTSEWHFPRHPIARHYVCKAIFRHRRFLRRACWWSGR